DGADDLAMRARVLRASALVAQARPADAIALVAPWRPSLARGADVAAVDALLVLADALSGDNRNAEAQAVGADARVVAERVGEGRERLLLRVDAARTRYLVNAQDYARGLALAD